MITVHMCETFSTVIHSSNYVLSCMVILLVEGSTYVASIEAYANHCTGPCVADELFIVAGNLPRPV